MAQNPHSNHGSRVTFYSSHGFQLLTSTFSLGPPPQNLCPVSLGGVFDVCLVCDFPDSSLLLTSHPLCYTQLHPSLMQLQGFCFGGFRQPPPSSTCTSSVLLAIRLKTVVLKDGSILLLHKCPEIGVRLIGKWQWWWSRLVLENFPPRELCFASLFYYQTLLYSLEALFPFLSVLLLSCVEPNTPLLFSILSTLVCLGVWNSTFMHPSLNVNTSLGSISN